MTTWLAFCWRNKKWTGPTVLVLAAIATGLVVWQWPQISSSYLSTRDLLSRSLGFGFLLPLLWAATLTLAIWKMRFLLKARFINRWLAALLGTFALWGALAFFPADSGLLNEYTLGGHIGRSLKGSSDLIGVLRLAGATAFALVLAFPLGSRRFSKYAAEKLHLAAVTIRPHIARLFRKLGSMRAERARRRAERAQMKEEIALASLAAYNLKEDSSKPRITVQEAPVPRVVVNPRNASSASRSLEMGVVEAPPRPAARPAREPVVERELAEQPAPVAAKPERASKVAPLNLEIQTPRAPLRLEDWKLPPVTLLTEAPAESQEPGVDQEKTSSLIENTLSEYGIEVNVAEVKIGPVVTMFGLVPGWVRRSRQARAKAAEGEDAQANAGDRTRVRVDSIVAREKDLALALAAPSLRIEAPIPGASLVGIEVPNARPASVTLRGVMETVPYKSLLEKSKLALALGLGSGGEVAVADLARMPHLLIAGSTGSGKSVCINTVISCMIMQNSPWETRLLLIDPKRVELTPYNGIPHLIIPVVVEPEVAVQSLRGLVQEMLSRYKLLEEAGARNIASYNQDLPPEEQMPFIVVAVDELADLMMAAPHDIEHSIIRLAQLGRATGIHMIVATQRPSVNVVTGLIKANFPGRISFAVASQIDSRTILDAAGAEKLLGRGDMLFQPPDGPKPTRIQGAFLSDTDIEEVVKHWQGQRGPLPPPIPLEGGEPLTGGGGGQPSGGDHGDDLMEKAWEIATSHNRLSTSLLQRRLRIGYPRAARLMDLLEEEGVIGPGEAGKSRDVLVSRGKRPGPED